MKFKVGDYIIGNNEARGYVFTRPGTKWYVASIRAHTIYVGDSPRNEQYPVDPKCFDLIIRKDKRKAPAWL